ncbi:hypothetical protein OGH69_00900 [Flavobacterium sp. MFBS3-15]|uniref:hypothetical protein n=1 Tax=Flavobacterium sp. MFBS3-15 TaxID=2989816 RepID=UPI002236288E|nr:hypothetical protein [Flavobacterium sp. MFBS3-15]MCW4467512.1 hypothetical protein [Flavobacterium sp. MFBS3-15]
MYRLVFLFLSVSALAQPPKMELEPYGFDPIEVSIPATPNDKLIEITTAWAQEFNRKESGADVTEVTTNSLTISAYKRNGFFYRDRGETHSHRIHYSMKITFYENRYTVAFATDDIYSDGDKLITYKIPDYFTPEGKLKDGYTDLKPSLERTVNDIVTSHYNFIINFR